MPKLEMNMLRKLLRRDIFMNAIESSMIHAIKKDLAYYCLEGGNVHEQKTGIIALLRACIDIDFRVLLFWRISIALCSRKSTKCFGILLYYRIKSRYSADLSPWAVVAAGIRLMHAFGIVVGPGVCIESGTKIFHDVTLGMSRPDSKELMMPQVGSYCILGAGSRILGPVSIPDGSLVPANALVTITEIKKERVNLSNVSREWKKNVAEAINGK